jgi:hypothetical protein
MKLLQHVVLVDLKPLAEDLGAAPRSLEILGGQKFLGPPIFLGPPNRYRRHFNSTDRSRCELQNISTTAGSEVYFSIQKSSKLRKGHVITRVSYYRILPDLADRCSLISPLI